MIILSASDVKIEFGTDVILECVSIGVNEGEKVGIVGVNGAGKSMFLRALTGKIQISSGEVFKASGKTLGFLEQDTGLASDNVIYDEMLLAFPQLVADERRLAELVSRLNDTTLSASEHMTLASQYTALEERFKRDGGYEYKNRITAMLVSLGFDKSKHSMRVNEFSGGQKTRLALSRLLLSEPDILVLDEPTNHLDIESIEWLETYLSQYKKTVLVVSHDRYFLDKVTNRTFEIENKTGKLYPCAYTEYVKRKEEDRKHDLKHYEIQQREIARLEAFVENQRRWNRERNIIAAESRLKAIDRMEKLDKPKNLPGQIHFKFETEDTVRTPFKLLDVSGLSKAYPGKPLFSDLEFHVHGKDRMFILGANGIGKSTLLKILCGRVPADTGAFEYAEGLSIGYYDQEQQGLDPDNTIIDELWECFPDKTQTEIRSALACFLFTAEDVFKKIDVLSGGEKARLTFAKLMLEKTDMLILDEPTNHLDSPSREVLENALSEYGGTILAVSHDRYFIKKLAGRILEMRADGCTVFEGGYEDYQAFCARRSAAPSAPELKSESGEGASDAKTEYQKNKEQKNRSRNTEKKIAETERKIAKLEADLAENAAAQDKAGSDYLALQTLCDDAKRMESELEALYETLDSLGAL